MEHHAIPLHTKRLLLRPYEEGDAKGMYRNWCADDEVTKYLTWPSHASIEVTKKRLEYLLAFQMGERHYVWAIVLGDEPVGSIDVTENYGDGGCQIGYCLARRYWSQNYMSEAFHAVLAFLFYQAGYSYVLMKAMRENVASRRVIEKQRFHYEYDEEMEVPLKKKTVVVAVYTLYKEEFVN